MITAQTNAGYVLVGGGEVVDVEVDFVGAHEGKVGI